MRGSESATIPTATDTRDLPRHLLARVNLLGPPGHDSVVDAVTHAETGGIARSSSEGRGRLEDAEDRRARVDAVYRQSGAGLWRTLYIYSGGRPAIVEDAIAEAFALALGFPGEIVNLQGWIYRVAFRLVTKELRRDFVTLPEEEFAQPQPDPDALHDLVGALHHLSPNQRAAIVLHYSCDLPVREVARVLGMTAATVRVHLHRGRLQLRAHLIPEPKEESS